MMKIPLLLSTFLNFVIFATFSTGTFDLGLLNVVIHDQTPTTLTVAVPTATSTVAPTNSPKSNQSPINESLDPTEDVTPTPTVTPPPQKKNPAPTHTPRPTSTPVTIPPPASPSATSLMILFGLLAVIVVIVGVWLNRPSK